MDPQQQFCLKWNSFGNNLVTAFDSLFKSESLTDVTLFCDGVTFKAHKLILAACSKHFQDLFEAAPLCPSVVVILDGTSSSNMSALLEFMYKGEVHVSHDSLSSFLKAAECLQVKGLSIEHEKLAVAQGHVTTVEPQVDSPTGRCNKQTKSSCPPTSSAEVSGGRSKDAAGEGGGGGGDPVPPSTMHPAPSTSSSSSYTPSLSPYVPHYITSYEQAVPPSSYEPHPRKRHHRSPSDSSIRASVLRDGSKPEFPPSTPPSGMSDYPRRTSPTISRYDGGADNTTSIPSNSAATAVTAITFDRTGAVDSEPPPDVWQSTSSCPEDLRVKLEPPNERDREHERERERERGRENVRERMKSEWSGTGGYSEGGPAPENAGPEIMWNSGKSTKIAATHKAPSAASTPDGKKLQCPFCERLYGYETNLRAHIRQRHQGIRVPCPFCSRTFTRNNTVRRHIAREHKTELSLKAFQQTQAYTTDSVQNHSQ